MPEHKPITTEEIATITARDSFKLEQARKKLGVTQTFLAACINMPPSSYNKMVNHGERIPKKYLEPICHVLTGIYYVRQGRKVVPVKNGKRDDGEVSVYSEVLEFLETVTDPKISVKDSLLLEKDDILESLFIDLENRANQLIQKLKEKTK